MDEWRSAYSRFMRDEINAQEFRLFLRWINSGSLGAGLDLFLRGIL